MSIKIDKKVELPRKSSTMIKYPFDKMKVGDSFFIEQARKRHTIYSCLKAYNALPKTKDKIQITTRGEGKGLRVWRIA